MNAKFIVLVRVSQKACLYPVLIHGQWDILRMSVVQGEAALDLWDPPSSVDGRQFFASMKGSWS